MRGVQNSSRYARLQFDVQIKGTLCKRYSYRARNMAKCETQKEASRTKASRGDSRVQPLASWVLRKPPKYIHNLNAIIHLCFYPYSDLPHHNFASENSFEPLVFLVLSMSFILLRFSALESSMSSTTASVWIIIVINSWILLLLMGIIFYRLIITGYENLSGCFCSGSGANAERTNFQSVNQFAVREQPTLGERWWGILYLRPRSGVYLHSPKCPVLSSFR